MGARVLPVLSLIHGTTFCATKPPRLPTALMTAKPAAALDPVRKLLGNVQKIGWAEKMQAAATQSRANFVALPGTTTLPTRHNAPIATGMTMCQVFSPTRSEWRGTAQRAKAVSTQGRILIMPFTVFDTPKPFTTVGSQ